MYNSFQYVQTVSSTCHLPYFMQYVWIQIIRAKMPSIGTGIGQLKKLFYQLALQNMLRKGMNPLTRVQVI